MKTLLSIALAVLCIQAVFGADPHEHSKVVCYWNSTAYERQGGLFSCVHHSHSREIDWKNVYDLVNQVAFWEIKNFAIKRVTNKRDISS